MQSYRSRGVFYEALTNEILDDLSKISKPRWMKIVSRFTPRGGITTEVSAEYKNKK
jgi:7-cyano-7-deazaguanine reductase